MAEALDWTTGIWYEFNDEDVTMLEGGPASSFDRDDKKKSSPEIEGSEDAYNLFYVESSYLAEQLSVEVKSYREREIRSRSHLDRDDIVTSVDNLRIDRYKIEIE